MGWVSLHSTQPNPTQPNPTQPNPTYTTTQLIDVVLDERLVTTVGAVVFGVGRFIFFIQKNPRIKAANSIEPWIALSAGREVEDARQLYRRVFSQASH